MRSKTFYVLDAADKPVLARDGLEWEAFIRDEEPRRLIEFCIVGNASISTCFTGIDRPRRGDGEPLVWETLIRGGEHDGYRESYSSRQDAVEGHHRAFELVTKGGTGVQS